MTTPRVATGVRCAAADEGAVLLDTRSGRLFGLNPTAAAMWDHLAKGHSLEETATALATRYEIEPARARADLETLIGELRDRGLIEGTRA